MTENRFKRISVCGDWGIKDVQNDKVLFFGTNDEVNDTFEVLNELHDENQELRKFIMDLQNMIQFDVDNGIKTYPIKLSEYLANVLKEICND